MISSKGKYLFLLDMFHLNYFHRDKPTYYGETPLGFACCTEQWNMVEILLKYGADMDAVGYIEYILEKKNFSLNLFLSRPIAMGIIFFMYLLFERYRTCIQNLKHAGSKTKQ